MFEAALVIGISIIISQVIKLSHSIKPRRALAQISVNGPTERGEEAMSLVGTIFEDESIEEIDEKVKKIAAIRERRVAFCNQRMLDITGNKEEILDEAKKVVEQAGLKVVE